MTIRTVRQPVFFLILVACLASLPAWCRAPRELQDQLNSAFKGKTGLLRNFYSGSDLHYDQNGVLQDAEATRGPWTLAGVEITGVKVTAQGVEIAGNRLGVLYTDGKQSFVRLGKLKIHVEETISSVDTLADIDLMLGKILIKPEDLLPVVPVYWRSYLTGTDSKSRSAAYQASVEENGNPTSKVANAPTTDAPATKTTPPRLLRSSDPQYNGEAASHHVVGVAVLSVVIDVTGAAISISIVRPLGMGLDEQTVLAVGQWKFLPATRNGQPVQALIAIEVAFK
jgi:TonB family protein